MASSTRTLCYLETASFFEARKCKQEVEDGF